MLAPRCADLPGIAGVVGAMLAGSGVTVVESARSGDVGTLRPRARGRPGRAAARRRVRGARGAKFRLGRCALLAGANALDFR